MISAILDRFRRRPAAVEPVQTPPAAPACPLTPRDIERLSGVHGDLVRVIRRARLSSDFIVTEGLRTLQRQQQLVAEGKSKTMNSRHLTGHAVDLAPRVGAVVVWDWSAFHPMAAAVKAAAEAEGVEIVWGGDWKSFPDGPHFELSRSVYPG